MKNRKFSVAKYSYACFECRLSFKRDMICPNCHVQLTCMGQSFKAPRRESIKQWRKVKMIRDAGIHFNHNTGKVGNSIRSAKEYLQDKKDKIYNCKCQTCKCNGQILAVKWKK